MDVFEEWEALHKPQLESSGVPQHFWKSLHVKLKDQIFDAGDKFSIFLVDYGEEERGQHDPQFRVFVSTVDGIDAHNPEHVYLIDHAWTYRAHEAQQQLKQIPGLMGRMAKLMGCDEDLPESELIEEVCKRMWKFNQTYAIGHGATVEDRMPVWYIMDEFGSAIQHSDDPNFRVIPFVHVPEQITYSILFPIRNAVHNEEVTRNFIEGCLSDDEGTKQALLLPWFPSDLTDVCFEQEEPSEDYFLEGHIKETLPDLKALAAQQQPVGDRVLKVYADYKYIHEYLKHPRFVMTDNETDADILWYTSHFKAFESLSVQSPQKFVNQFPYENLLTIKDLLCIVCRRKTTKGAQSYDPDSLETYPLWLPTTFNMKTELPKFVSYYQQREEKNLDNHWICKPWNLARGLDTHVTNNLDYILRLPFSGPKIAQKYIHNPVLFNRAEIGPVKFDVRYVILLKSVDPLKAYVYRNFFLRFSNKPFELKDLDDYEKHFTVMNYNEDAPLCKMLHSEFILAFEQQQPNQTWKSVEGEIFSMLREVMECATFKQPPLGIGDSPQSRALYAVDLMLEWTKDSHGLDRVQPKLLEINWTPDCRRACEYYPNFYNDIFSLLFLDEENHDVFALL